MTEARIPLLSLEEARQAARDAEIPEALAELNIFRVLLHHPMLAGQLSGMLLSLLVRGKLDARLRELVIMRIGWATGSRGPTFPWKGGGSGDPPPRPFIDPGQVAVMYTRPLKGRAMKQSSPSLQK